MARFFTRLAIAALADWVTWQISTPDMRFWRITRKHRRQFTYILEASIPVVRELGEVIQRTADEFFQFAQEWRRV